MLDEKEKKLNELLTLFQDDDEIAKLMLEQNFESNEEYLISKIIYHQLNDNVKKEPQEKEFKIL